MEGWLIEQDIVEKCGVAAAFIYSVLKAQYLANSADFPASIDEIVQSVPFATNTVNRAVRKLEDSGYITRNKKNHCAKYVYRVQCTA